MINQVTIEEFLQKAENLPVLDARAPKEYQAGHILQAQSFPIFTDEERAIVGTSYKQQGHDPAVLLGLDLFGPKMSEFVKEATRIAPDKEVLLHCWRGGMRSGAMAWLLSFAGFKIHLLQGGYKAYRHFIQEQFAKPWPIVVLSGFTGSGKTDILPYLQQHGQRTIDLEGLANHKGSAFGSIGMPAQPTTEHFENLLGSELLKLNAQQAVWFEDEGMTIGRIKMPHELFINMQQRPTIVIDVPKQLRVRKLAHEYCRTDQAILEASILKIKKRLGGLATQEALDAIATGDMEKMVEIALTYYDKAYHYQLKPKQQVLTLPLQTIDPEESAQQIITFAKTNNLI
ncbi:tRNA 2-selenouridine(34) synthase MnmH [Pontibacter sp. BT310]|uniref:tRNA 2-selenouridine(34) synthase MnmH n=1 Tax=Pontibacter populi TaxID=890055 RepID=A0ABS6XFQ0_9BACT|nr:MULTISPECIES: tRNA 2-selenouridine(34) synthase MnmH [Pontibacter]MBJ6119964.1 tRNA 2-selenouridine(34) synthase MnmH [Pontibacter sp. BT310]MBR0572393.1 tRNA 2-selenouridine(34) synthase MnmH [Microvirga sp. STS03]MBW3366817.1 tRNA 2-selenouridine(34) synthase MnmH [Pontibacter populi]